MSQETAIVETGTELERLKIEAREAVEKFHRLEAQYQTALRQVGELGGQIEDARAIRDKALAAYHRVVPEIQPPVPNYDKMMAAAIRQCPDRDRAAIKRIVARSHAGATIGHRAGEKYLPTEDPEHPEATVDGKEVRNVEDTHYSIPAPPREVKSYG